MSSLKRIVMDGLMRGQSSCDLIALNPTLNPASIRSTVSHLRKVDGITAPRPTPGPPVQLPEHVRIALQREAQARGLNQSANMLALRVLALVIENDMFDTVLGEQQ